jgi:hypothetical protein
MFCLNEKPSVELNKCILFTSEAVRYELLKIEGKLNENER